MTVLGEKDTRVLIVGGGIVGLAFAYKLQKSNPRVQITLLEKESEVAQHQTGHNSGVLHSGLYYQPGSLKARLCTYGLKQMTAFCEENEVAFERCGKVVVATQSEELPRLESLFQRGQQNGIEGMQLLSPEALREREPRAAGIKALWVPSTGIVDYGAVCQKLKALIQAAGGRVLTGHKFECAEISDQGRWQVKVSGAEQIETDFLVNCAGLQSDEVLTRSGFQRPVRIVPFRGEYFMLKLSRQHLVRNLIYPVPDPEFPFLGVHFTRMVKGGVECGPNAVLALRREGYRWSQMQPAEIFDYATYPGFWRFASKHWRTGFQEVFRSLSRRLFCESLQRLVPDVKEQDLEPAGAGVRAQAMAADGTLVQDFSIVAEKRSLHVLNTPSPAATASLAIADELVRRFEGL